MTQQELLSRIKALRIEYDRAGSIAEQEGIEAQLVHLEYNLAHGISPLRTP